MIQIELTSPTSFEKESANSRENSQEKNRLLGKHTECTKYRLVERKEILLTLQKFQSKSLGATDRRHKSGIQRD